MDSSQSLQLKPEYFFNNKTEGPYPFGVDPVCRRVVQKVIYHSTRYRDKTVKKMFLFENNCFYGFVLKFKKTLFSYVS